MSAPFFGAPTAGALGAGLAIGIAFGWFLERGGLGNARKLAGQFYLTDFTVLKVMFSAIVTAMLGVFALDAAGVLDASRVQVPETFVLPQTLGGVVFGAGFAIAGLCPGTSCVAGASGRIDGLAAIAGLLAGVLLFAEAWPLVGGLYDATPMGTYRLPTLLGLGEAASIAVVCLTAAVLFAASEWFERRNQR